MLMNVRMETGLLLGTIETAGYWRPGMHLDAHMPMSVSAPDPRVHLDAVVPAPALVMRMPVREWVSPGGHSEHSFHVDDASHAEVFSNMNFQGSVLAIRNAAAIHALPVSAMEHVVSPTAFGPVREEQVRLHLHPSAWEYMLLMEPRLEAQVRTEWNTRLLAIPPASVPQDPIWMGEITPSREDFNFNTLAIAPGATVSIANLTVTIPEDVAADAHPTIGEDLRRRMVEHMTQELEGAMLNTLRGTETGRFSGLGPNNLNGPRGEPAPPPPTTRAYSTVRRALDI